MLNELQKKTALAIVNIFESGKPLGDYGCVTVMKGDTGHLTYGRSQTTLGSGNLALLLHAYCDAGGALSDALMPFLPAFDRRDFKLDLNEKVKGILREAGKDPMMKRAQDDFFDRAYWAPALKSAGYIGVNKPLGISVIYDSRIQGAYHIIRDLTISRYGQVNVTGEEEWIKAYVSVRRDWLASNTNEALHPTVYRMDAFNRLIDENKWNLPLPMTVRNVVITEDIFGNDYQLPVVVSAAGPEERVLFLTRPRMRGEDVRKLQQALGFTGDAADGIFGNDTDRAVRSFQRSRGLKEDGKAGTATWAELGH